MSISEKENAYTFIVALFENIVVDLDGFQSFFDLYWLSLQSNRGCNDRKTQLHSLQVIISSFFHRFMSRKASPLDQLQSNQCAGMTLWLRKMLN